MLDSEWQKMEHSQGGPSFRWKLAETYVAQRRKYRAWLDETTQQAADYLCLVQKDSDGIVVAKAEFPMIAAACELMINRKTQEVFKLSVLGNLPGHDTCARLNVEPSVLDMAKALFFDLEGKREAISWITCRVIAPDQNEHGADFGAKMRLAFFGGPVVTQAMLQANEDLPFTEAQRLGDQELLLHAKLQAATEYQVTPANSQKFLEMYLDYDIRRKKIDLEREKFRHKCELSARQYEAKQSPSLQPESTKHSDLGEESENASAPCSQKRSYRKNVA